MPNTLRRLFEPEHEEFRRAVRTFIGREITPNLARWEADRLIDRDAWIAAGKQGLLGLAAPSSLGGGGNDDYRFRVVLIEELAAAGAASVTSGFSTQDDIFLPYVLDLGTPEQRERIVPGMCSGELIGAIAMTEPGTGSDLKAMTTTALRDGDEYVLNGSKTFITSGIHADWVIVAVKTDPAAGAKGVSLILVERGTPGFERGRKLDKVGLHAQDTAELFFNDCRVPVANLLGTEGRGFVHLMERLGLERLGIAVSAVAGARAALTWTLEYVKARPAFGGRVADFQNTQFVLADVETRVTASEIYLDEAVRAFGEGRLSAVEAAKTKLWATHVQKDVVDACVQLHGGYGYMLEYPIARAYVDCRVQSIYGGTSEIMKLVIGRELVAD